MGVAQKEITYKVKLKGSDGKDYVETFEALKQDLGLPKTIQDLYNEIARLCWAVNILQEICISQLTEKLVPIMRDYLKKTYKKGFRGFEVYDRFQDEYSRQASVKALDVLIANGEVSIKNGWYRLEKEAT